MPLATTPFDTAQDCLNAAIVFANDGGSPAGMSGNVLNPNTNPQVIPALKERYRFLQQRLISAGVDTFTKTENIYGLSPSATSNPRQLMILTYNGYFNGQTWSGPNVTAPTWNGVTTYTQGMTVLYNGSYYVALPNSVANLNKAPDSSVTFWQPFSNIGPCLPPDLVKPLEMWEDQTGGNHWNPMKQNPDSLVCNTISPRFGRWVFEDNKLYLPPASQMNDLQIKYLAMAPDIATLATPLVVRGCTTALAYLVLDILSGSRGGPQADYFKNRAEEAINQIINQTVRKQAYAQFVRAPYRGGRGRGRRVGGF